MSCYTSLFIACALHPVAVFRHSDVKNIEFYIIINKLFHVQHHKQYTGAKLITLIRT